MNEIPVVHIRQTRMITVKLAGASWGWLYDNTSWGALEQDTQLDKDARAAVLAADRRKVGKGRIFTASMPDEQAESVWGILNSIAGVGESMTTEERGDAVYTFRAMRRDAGRIQESLEAIGWELSPKGYFTVSASPEESK